MSRGPLLSAFELRSITVLKKENTSLKLMNCKAFKKYIVKNKPIKFEPKLKYYPFTEFFIPTEGVTKRSYLKKFVSCNFIENEPTK